MYFDYVYEVSKLSQLESDSGNQLMTVLPFPDIWARQFWEHARNEVLALQRCSECGDFRYPPSPCCPKCMHTESTWEAMSGFGKVVSWVVFHQNYYPGTTFAVPYNTAIVELDEGPRLISNLVEIENSEIVIGMPVEVLFKYLDEEFKLPQFRPVAKGEPNGS